MRPRIVAASPHRRDLCGDARRHDARGAAAELPSRCHEEERAELAAFLAAWYGERTAPPTTGDAAADAALVTLAGQRDAACACKDLACARQAGSALDAALSPGAPTTARDAAAKMVDEVARCRQKLATARERSSYVQCELTTATSLDRGANSRVPAPGPHR